MEKIINQTDTDFLIKKIENLIEKSKKHVVTQVNSIMVQTYYEIGHAIVENEQQGEVRASYGKGVLKELSQKLNARFGKGFSVDNLENMRKFYLTYSKVISETASRNSENKKSEALLQASGRQNQLAYTGFTLSWSHYIFLMRITNPDERNFYETEAIKACIK